MFHKESKKPCRNNYTNNQLNVLSLFSGCGGMDLGFEGGFEVHKRSYNSKINGTWKVKNLDNERVFLPHTRFKIIFANDIRPDARTAWTSYFSKSRRSEDHRVE